MYNFVSVKLRKENKNKKLCFSQKAIYFLIKYKLFFSYNYLNKIQIQKNPKKQKKTFLIIKVVNKEK